MGEKNTFLIIVLCMLGRCFQLVRPDAEPISSRRNSVKKHVMGCGLTALFLPGDDSPIGCFSARNPFLAEGGLLDHVGISTKLSTA